jgi:hypothetical protein
VPLVKSTRRVLENILPLAKATSTVVTETLRVTIYYEDLVTEETVSIDLSKTEGVSVH